MTQPNMPKLGKQKLQKFQWSVWFPYPSSWLKAFILAVFLRVIIFFVEITGKVGYRIADFANSIELLVVFIILSLLSPIPVITFTHHILHLFLARFLPAIQTREIGKPHGLIPGIISWWEGLYGWLVIVISTLLAFLIFTLLLPFFNLSFAKYPENYTPFEENIIVIFIITWLIKAALIYQLEYLVKQRFISVYFNINQTDKSQIELNSTLDIDAEFNQLRGEMGLHKMKSKPYPLSENMGLKNKEKPKKLFKKAPIIIWMIIVAVGIYLLAKLPNIPKSIPLFIVDNKKVQVPSPTSLITPSPVNITPTLKLKTETFREGVNKAISAANFTQSAKSQDEWKTVESEWQEAITLMNAVPSNSPNYAVAQQKIVEYQRNLSYAKKNAVGGK